MISLQDRRYQKKDSIQFNGSKSFIKKPKKGKLLNHPILCPICGNAEAGNHLHYGGRGCSSCRAFFRRSVQNESYTEFKCIASSAEKEDLGTKTGNCKIDSKSWKSCRYCRFERCVNTGMQPDLVLSKEQREHRQFKRKKNHAIKNVESIPPKDDQKLDIDTDGLEVERRLNSPLLLDELKEIAVRRKSFMDFVADRTIKYFSSRPQVSIEMIKSRYYQTILPYEVTQHLMNSRKFVAKEAFNTGKSSYELINSLPFQDFLQLVENNIPMVFNFAVAINTNEKTRLKSSKADFDSSMVKRLKAPKDGEERMLQNYYNSLQIPIESQCMDLHYWQYFSSPWAANIEFERRHLELTRQMSRWAISDESSCDLSYDKNIAPKEEIEEINEFTSDLQTPLMNSILLYSTVGLNTSVFERPDIIEKIQTYYLSKLHRYLKFRYGETKATNQISNGMKIVAVAREAQNIWLQRLPI